MSAGMERLSKGVQIILADLSEILTPCNWGKYWKDTPQNTRPTWPPIPLKPTTCPGVRHIVLLAGPVTGNPRYVVTGTENVTGILVRLTFGARLLTVKIADVLPRGWIVTPLGKTVYCVEGIAVIVRGTFVIIVKFEILLKIFKL
jgi:hypothetical protein